MGTRSLIFLATFFVLLGMDTKAWCAEDLVKQPDITVASLPALDQATTGMQLKGFDISQAIAVKGDGKIHLYDLHRNELLAVQFRNSQGRYDETALSQIQHLLRCRGDDREIAIPLKLIELVDHLEDHFHAGRVEIISGYRSPEFNQLLKSQGRGVVTNSQHIYGRAMDIRLPGVPLQALRNYAASLKIGGVGFYPGPEFVHVDVGRVRSW